MSNFVKKLRSLSSNPPLYDGNSNNEEISNSDSHQSTSDDDHVDLPRTENEIESKRISDLESKETREREDSFQKTKRSSIKAEEVNKKDDKKKKELDAFYNKFNLPHTEPIINTYSAALNKQGLVMHGRLYMTSNHLCFYSSLFNNKSVEKIKIEDIAEIKKSFHGIQVCTNDQKFNFVSFFHREKAFALLTRLVEGIKETNREDSFQKTKRSSIKAEEVNKKDDKKKKELDAFYNKFNLPHTEPIINTYSAALNKQGLVMHGRLYMTSNHLCFYSSLFNNKSVEKIKIEDIAEIKKSFHGIQVCTNDQKFNFVSFFHREKAFALLTRLVEGIKETNSGNHSEDEKELVGTPEANAGGTLTEEMMIEDSLLDSESEENLSEGFLNSTGDMNQLISASFPISVPKFFKLFFSDESSSFVQNYHKERGDSETVIKNWSSNSQFGNVRQVQYRAPVKAPIGPNTTRCDETQRYHLTKNRLLVETIGLYHDVPFGDTFRVEGRWEITSDGSSGCNLVASVCLYWIKKTWFKSKIESGTLKETKESFELWVNLAKQQLRQLGSPTIERAIESDSQPLPLSNSSVQNPIQIQKQEEKKAPRSLPWTRPIIFVSFGLLLIILSFLGLWASVSIVFFSDNWMFGLFGRLIGKANPQLGKKSGSIRAQ
eukprot:TRINITY_DN2705_c0_g1_i4.p1 TRINITY_DN2705_c0_g1~~TRINITY_DN2705_c0_g1_i4.p1  ORF type:complete len:668 (-),score=251.39 TRINITY_DN2705_c0_g1_i4:246-2222(-)